MKKLPLFIFLGILCIAILWKSYDKIVDGFYLYRTIPPKTLQISLTHAHPSSDVKAALDQPFYYLASGSQSFVFLSADKQFVLKLFKHYRWKPYSYWIPHYTKAWNEKKLSGLLTTYQSCLFCMEYFKEETALLYLQLTPSPQLHKSLTLYNRIGKKYSLPLETTSFVLQKYAQPVSQRLLAFQAQGNHAEAQSAIKALFDNLLIKRLQGFTDKDPNFLNNFGFVGNKAVSVDIGGLIKDPKKDTLYFCNQELKKVSKSFLPWLHKYYPELLTYTTTLMEEIKKQPLSIHP